MRSPLRVSCVAGTMITTRFTVCIAGLLCVAGLFVRSGGSLCAAGLLCVAGLLVRSGGILAWLVLHGKYLVMHVSCSVLGLTECRGSMT